MQPSQLVEDRIEQYKPAGNLDHTAKVILMMARVRHQDVKDHIERVALLAEATALVTGKDARAAFFAGLLHDVGKLLLPYQLFDGHDISAAEYQEVKTHALAGFQALKDTHLFTAMAAGLHHALYRKGYGLTVSDLPNEWGADTIRKVLNISAIVSICDFVDAFTHRNTKIKDGSDQAGPSLREMLLAKYPEDQQLIDVVLEQAEKLEAGYATV